MTELQRTNFYFPAWRRCADANDWVMDGGRLSAGDGVSGLGSREDSAYHLQVWTVATALARHDHCAITADHLRHACNWIATLSRDCGDQLSNHQPRAVSCHDLDNRQTSRVVDLFRLLTDPEDLDALIAWENPEVADKRSLVRWLKKLAPEAVLIAISKNAWGTIFWEDQEIDQLRWLARQVKSRSHRPRSRPRPRTLDSANSPF